MGNVASTNLDLLSLNDLNGNFLLAIDIPGPYLKAEIVFYEGKKYTIQTGTGDEVSKIWEGTFNFEHNILKGTHKLDDGKIVHLKIDLCKAKKIRVFRQSDVKADSNEINTGTEHKFGSQVMTVIGESPATPFRFVKLTQPFFRGVNPGKQSN